MHRTRWEIALTVLLVGIAILLAAALNGLGGFLDFLYRNVVGFSALRGIARIAIGISALAGLGVAGILGLGLALQPAPWPRKLLMILPAYFFVLLLAGLLMFLLRIGTTGPFAALWTAGSAVLTLIGATFAAARLAGAGRLRSLVQGMLGLASGGVILGGLALTLAALLAMAQGPSPAFVGRGRFGGEGAFPSAPGARPSGLPGTAPRGPEGFPLGPRPGEGPFAFRPGAEGRLPPLRISPSGMAAGGGALVLLGLAAGVLWIRSRRAGAPAEAAGSFWNWREGRRALAGGIGWTMGLLLVAQLIPVPRTNPPVRAAVAWDSPQTQALWQRACADCHSNETRWPWYTAIAPASWLVANHVIEGRQALNLSELDLSQLPSARKARLAEEIAQVIRNGTMPPADYLLLHPEARLSNLEKELLIQGLQETLSR